MPENTGKEASCKKDDDKDQVITPWKIEGEVVHGEAKGVDYTKIIDSFGCKKITESQIERIERITGKPPHRLLRRGLVFAHRDLDFILDCAENGKEFYIYTGRGPSSESMHLGHIIPFEFVAYLQRVFKAKLVIQMTDDEKFIFKDQLKLLEARKYATENAYDIIASGIDQEHTFLFSDLDYIGHLYPTVLEISKVISVHQCNVVFGFDKDSLLGMVAFPPVQIAPCFSEVFSHILRPGTPCLIPAAIDQDPYFRFGRDIAVKLRLPKPATIYSKFLPSLLGEFSKMSASVASSAIYLSDTSEEVSNKIHTYAFSGGRTTLAEHAEKGADVNVDVCCKYLQFFMEDDAKLAQITADSFRENDNQGDKEHNCGRS